MLARERRKQILEDIKKSGSVTIDGLLNRYKVTRMTIWRDLKNLEENGQLMRVHGGAILPNSFSNQEPQFEEKKKTCLKEKVAIAKYAAENFINENDIIFLDGGSTVMELIPFLQNKGITLITNGLNTLYLASKYASNINIISGGGVLRIPSMTFIGPEAEATVSRFNAEKVFLSCSGITQDLGIMDIHPLEMEIKKLMIKCADKKIVLVDSTKIFKKSLLALARFDEIDIIITDNKIKPQQVEFLKKKGVDLRIVSVD